MKKEDSDIRDSILKSVNAFVPQAEKNEIQLTTNAKSFVIYHDSERIKQVLTNLIKNAMIAVESKKGKIEVIIEENPTEIQISVKDNGNGNSKRQTKESLQKILSGRHHPYKRKGRKRIRISNM